MAGRDFVRTLASDGSLASRQLARVHLDPLMLIALFAVIGFGLVVLYSAIDRDPGIFTAQLVRLGLAFVAMAIAAQLSPRFYQRWTPVLYGTGLLLLVAVLLAGVTVKGSQRWLDLPGLPRFQPSEIMKLAVPLMVAWYFHDRRLPPSFSDVLFALAIITVPALLIARQPDLGTAIMVSSGGLAVIVLSGIHWRYLAYAGLAAAGAAPVLWFGLRDYQQQRILTLFDPESDPLGAGWNTIQSTTAIGSGGVFGKGLFEGTQSRLDFLPEARTDFIIAVVGEELGLVGIATLLILYLLVVARGLYIATVAQTTYGRLVAGSLTFTFFVYVFVNIAMVSGLLPIVGVPLPLVSYGGTSALTLMAGFGLLMAIHSNRTW